MSKILSIENLNVIYRIPEGRRHVLRDVSLSLEKGQIRAIVGESGCGKSTLVNALIGLLPDNAVIESGKILVDETDMLKSGQNDMRKLRSLKLGVVFQDPFSALDPLYTIEKQMAETINIADKINRKQAAETTAETPAENTAPAENTETAEN